MITRIDGQPISPIEQKALAALEARLRWASMHWGTEDVHPDAWPHVVRAALDAVTDALRAEAWDEGYRASADFDMWHQTNPANPYAGEVTS